MFNADGTYTYTSDDVYVGDDTFTYSLCDVDGDCSEATVTITILPVYDPSQNSSPVALDDYVTGYKDKPVHGNLLANDYDPDGDNLTVNTTAVSGPSHGTVTINADGTFTYTPDPGYVGQDTFVYEVCDDGSPVECAQATVTITVLDNGDVNSTVAVDDSFVTPYGTTLLGDVSTNDYDPEDDNQTFINITSPSHGSLVFNPDGTFAYEPDAGYSGSDSFTYQVCDDGTPVACDTATVHVTVLPFNDKPIAHNDINTVLLGASVTGDVSTNDYKSLDGGNVWSLDSGPTHGTLVFNADGTYTYTSDDVYVGDDTFTYSLCDVDGDCSEATVTITILPVYDPTENSSPVALDDNTVGYKDKPVHGDLLANDYDPDGDNLIVNTTPVSGPSHGTVTINPDGTFTYEPDAGYVGVDTFVYEVCDDGTPVKCDQATVTITVQDNDGANSTVAVDDHFVTPYGTLLSGDVSTNDYDPEDDNQTFINITSPSHGSLVFNPDGTFTYTPDAGYSGSDSFTYQVCDDGTPVACDTATVYITVLPCDANLVDMPIITVVQPDCINPMGMVSIDSYDASIVYEIIPAGPSIDALGVINNITLNTDYTIAIDFNGCISNPELFRLDNTTLDCDGDGVTADQDPDDFDPCVPFATPPPTVYDMSFCELDNPTGGNLEAIGQNIRWYTDSTYTNLLDMNTILADNTKLYASQTVNNCESELVEVNISVFDAVIPVFDYNRHLCLASEPLVLPTISDNGIKGRWKDSIAYADQLGFFTFVFTPDSGECAHEIIDTIWVSNKGLIVKNPEPLIDLCLNLSDIVLSVEVIADNWIELDYQWFFNGQPIPGANDSIYITDFILDKIGMYFVEIYGCCEVIRSAEVEVDENHLYVEQKWGDVLAVNNVTDEYVAYQWYRNDSPIRREGTSQYYTDIYGLNGDYYVIAYREDGTFIQSCPVSFERERVFDVKVFPNPAAIGESIYVEMIDNMNESYEIKLVDSYGRVIRTIKGSGETAIIESNGLINGTYFINVKTKFGFKAMPIILNR